MIDEPVRSAFVRWGAKVGMLVVVGCASGTTSEVPAVAPSSGPAPSAMPGPAAAPTVASDVLEPRRDVRDVRERQNAVADHLTMKQLKPHALSTNAALEGGEELAGASAAPIATRTPFVPFIFAERRASEARDHLATVVAIRHERRGDVITLQGDKLVEPGQWAITASGQYTLRELASALRDQDGHTIFIHGYTDSLGTAVVNDALSLRRAEAVRDYLTSQGVATENMRAEGHGAKRPVASNATPEGRAQNRRIEIVIAP